ncbi:ROK family transcriptional regulator [Klenkia brasiliensis]|uniref:Sugar kinase of the NBD/HSP70 family, may contain an N-terminal HTH domain n=1 Tax=Klenkia brasiliensis TaxID=333142 RepID=A0A1G7PUV7_9ACTN|nr:ROK family transcriptional regulator [Klenkia brasiliensis]SDF90102.1 Sugar kinase of the NBD/HSP70 family, may contain an N-terminal HTH domain [Klenkia brasiliensis]
MTDLREANRGAVLSDLLLHRPTTRTAIAQRTGLSAATISRAVEVLVADGVVREVSEVVSANRGRRAVALDLVGERSVVAGVDLGASATRVVLVDFAGSELRRWEQPTRSDLPAADLADWLAGMLTDRSADLGAGLAAVSVGLPGAVAESGAVSNAPNLPQVMDPGFVTGLRRAGGVGVRVDNDVNYALLGEQRRGAAAHAGDAAMVTIGAGLGAALAIDGRILHGRHGLIGEFGQLPAGPMGTRLEHMVTGPGILRRAEEAGVPLARPQDLFAEEHRLSPLRTQFDHALQIVLTAVAVASEPEVVVLGGGIADSLAGDLDRYQATLGATLQVAPRLVPAELGAFSGAIGAAIDAVHSLYADLGAEPGLGGGHGRSAAS